MRSNRCGLSFSEAGEKDHRDLKLRGEMVEAMREPFIFLRPCSQTLPDHYNSSKLDRELA